MRLRGGGQARRRRRRIRKLRLLSLLSVLLLLGGAAFCLGFVRAVSTEIPKLDPANPRGADDLDTVIYAAPDANGDKRVLAVLRGAESRVLVRSIREVAPIMRQAIVSVEDRRFYEHDGVDLRGIARALWQDIRNTKVVEGGSTITQQFVKNAYIRNEQTIGRKVREAALAWQLEKQWKSKNRILIAYLNTIYFGNGAYGIQQAARTYFHKGARHLQLHEAALLAGLPADPGRYDPAQHPREARSRRHFVLATMLDEGKISPAELEQADAKPLPRPEDVRLPGTQGPAPYFVNYVKDQLVERYRAHGVFGGGLRVTTTIDLGLQELARAAIEKVLEDPEGPAAALVSIDPRDGAIKVMFGGTNFRRSQFNLATQAERQPGSAFKPVVLATAFRQGISPETEFDSKPVKIDAGGRIWSVRNYEGTYLGRSDLWRAMVHSDNSVYAQLTQLVGPRAIVKTAKELGIRAQLDPYFSIGLGAVGVNPLDMARAYATIANGGRRVDGAVFGNRPRVIAEIEEIRNERVRKNGRINVPVLDPDAAATLTAILEDVVQAGTGRRAALSGQAAAGKTGTTDSYGDAWFVGYTPELVTAVWVGYPNELRSMETEFGGEPVAGGTLPALIWKEFMNRVRAARGPGRSEFEPPPVTSGISTRVVRRGGWKLDNGFCPGTRVVVYFSGKAPAEQADCKPNEVTVPLVVGQSLESARTRLSAEPLDISLIGIPATRKTRPGVVVKQEPSGGFLSAGDTVRLHVAIAEHGTLPNLVGSSYRDVVRHLRRRDLRLRVRTTDGRRGVVVEQWPRPGIAIKPGETVLVVVGE